MNKKLILIPMIILIISFSAGIFTEIAVPAENLQLPTSLPSLGASLLEYIKSDIITVAAALIFSISVFLMPLSALIAVGKTFSLGFSAAYILSSSSEKALGILIAALVPRGIFKIPAYIALVVISLDTAAFVKKNYQNPAALKRGGMSLLLRFLFCFLLLAGSSLLEAFLLRRVLLP